MRTKVFVSAIAFSLVGNLAATRDFLVVFLNYVCHDSCTAVADLEIVSVEYLVEFIEFGEMFIKCGNSLNFSLLLHLVSHLGREMSESTG